MLKPVSLTPDEAACLEALRAGADRKIAVALQVSLNLGQTQRALEKLAALGLAAPSGRRGAWHPTRRGKVVDMAIAIVPAARRRGRKPMEKLVPGPSAARLLALLQRPRRGAELPALLGVTRQRVHQLVAELSALGLIRSADPNFPALVIALRDDPSVLLRQAEDRALSAFPQTEATTLAKVAAAARMPAGRTAALADFLCRLNLIERMSAAASSDLYRLTAAGAAHWQRSATARRAEAPPPPFRSDRVHGVLSCLATQGPTRTRDVAIVLKAPQQSVNALMQYLKRKNAVRPQTDARHAPYILTPDGHDMLSAMKAARIGHDGERSRC